MSTIDAAIIKALVDHVGTNSESGSTPSSPSTNNTSSQAMSAIANVGWSSKVEAEYYDNYLTSTDDSLNGDDRILIIQTNNGYEAYYCESRTEDTLTYKNYTKDERITFTKNPKSGIWQTKDVNRDSLSNLPNNTITGALKPACEMDCTSSNYEISFTPPSFAACFKYTFVLYFMNKLYVFIYDRHTGSSFSTVGSGEIYYKDIMGSTDYIKLSTKDGMSGTAFINFYNESNQQTNSPIFNLAVENKNKQGVGIYEALTTPTWAFYDMPMNVITYLFAKISSPITSGTIFRYTCASSTLEFVCTTVSETEMTFIDSSGKSITLNYFTNEGQWRVSVPENTLVPDNIQTGLFEPKSLVWAYIKFLHAAN